MSKPHLTVVDPEASAAAAAPVERAGVSLELGDALDLYAGWRPPTVIISDGPYGLNSFPGDLANPDGLAEEYRRHVEAWSEHALPSTTLWFWNSELGWANVHGLLQEHGWEYRSCHIWDKGVGHVAGNANSRTLRKFPVVTEVCVQYVRANRLPLGAGGKPVTFEAGNMLTLKQWVRAEWQRAGLPLSITNEVCGVKNAATRKWLTQCHLWYFPPPEFFVMLAAYANEHGDPSGRPYYSADGQRPMMADEWEGMRAKFHCLFGINNVWAEPPVRGAERIKDGAKPLHMNQKPLKLVERTILASSDVGDVVWEPFAGTATGLVAALRTGRRAHGAEISERFFQLALQRLAQTSLDDLQIHPATETVEDTLIVGGTVDDVVVVGDTVAENLVSGK